MSGRLNGRRIVVTGAASGIGRATATLFAAEGARVALLDRVRDGVVAAAATIAGSHAEVVDISDEVSVSTAFDRAAGAFGGLDGLVHCAGIVQLASIEETTLAMWQRHLDVNLTGAFLVCRTALGHLRRAGGGTIVNLASAQALSPAGNSIAYASSKGGVVTLTKAIALEGAPNVRANVVCPGLVDTPMHDALRPSPDSPPPVPLDKYPLARWSTAEEVARSNLYLTCDDSAYVTGITLAVDGGRTMH